MRQAPALRAWVRVPVIGPMGAFAIVRKCAGPGPVRKQGGGRGAVGAQAALALAARGFPAMLGLRSHRETRCTHCVRCARTLAVSQITKRAGTRADRNPVPCRPRWAQAPSRSPGTNSPLDCSCPGSPPRRRTGAPPRTRPRLCQAAAVLGGASPRRASSPVRLPRAAARVQAPAGLDARLGLSPPKNPSCLAKPWAGRGGATVRRRGGEPGHEQSSGLFVPGERLGACAQRALQGQGCGRRAYSRASSI